MKTTQSVWSVLLATGAAISLCAGCKSSRPVDARQNAPISISGDAVVSSYGAALELPRVQVTSADGKYNFAYTVRSELEGSKAEPTGSQKVDLGKGGSSFSDYRLYLDRGFAVFGGCFPVYIPPIPDGTGVTLPPRPWAPMVAAGSVAASAQGTRFSVYNETNSTGEVIKIYIFRHSGGPVHAWVFPEGTNPQIAGPFDTIPQYSSQDRYLLAQRNSSGAWQLSLQNLPPSGDSSLVRKYFDACHAIAGAQSMAFPVCSGSSEN